MSNQSRLQKNVDCSINECQTLWGQLFEIFTSSLVILICVIFIAGTYPISEKFLHLLSTMETSITIFFLVEYLLRWWSKNYSLKHLCSPLSIIDFFAILPLFISESNWQFIRLLRLFRILRLLRIFQYQKLLFKKIEEYHLRILKILFTLTCLVFISAGLIYDVEHTIPSTNVKTFFNALYFSIVTLSTVGFGDILPMSWQGQAITMMMIISGALLIPWQIGNLVRSILISTKKDEFSCKKCLLNYHDSDANYCKSCGHSLLEIKQTLKR